MNKVLQQVEEALVVQIEPWVDQAELKELTRVITSTFLTEHDLTREFESMTAQLTGAKHAIAVCNGSMALFTSLKALGVGPGDEVIVPNFTFIASANAVILAGAVPVLCEVLPDTFCIDMRSAEKAVTSRTKVVMPVHLYGQSANMPEVLEFARKHHLRVLEDAAEGIGVRYDGRHVGTFGEMGILSYYGNKTITCGEGGIILTDDDDLAKAAYRLKNYGRDRKGTYVHESIGFNFSFTDLQAAIGVAQMKKLSAVVARKRAIHDRYVSELKSIPGFRPVYIDPRCEPVFWFTSFSCADPQSLSTYLHENNIQTRRFFLPLHQQPCYADHRHVRLAEQNYQISEDIYRAGISLPSSYSLTESDQSRIIEQIRIFYARRG